MKWHWILTVQFAIGRNGYGIRTDDGTLTAGPLITREIAYAQLLAKVRERAGTQETNTMFFSLEPDDMAPAVARVI